MQATENKTGTPAIQITARAVSKLTAFRDEEGHDQQSFLRVSVETGGCSGLSYKLGWDKEKRANDQELEIHGLKVVLDMRSFLYLAGTTLDFSEGLNGKGFEFHNPNATRTCGCGESFAV